MLGRRTPVSITEELCALRGGQCTRWGAAQSRVPASRVQCLGSLLHKRSICRKNESPRLPLAGTAPHAAGACRRQDESQWAGLNIKGTWPTKTAIMLSKIRLDCNGSGRWGELPDRASGLLETYRQEARGRCTQSDLGESIQTPAGTRPEGRTGSSTLRIPENTFSPQFRLVPPFVAPNSPRTRLWTSCLRGGISRCHQKTRHGLALVPGGGRGTRGTEMDCLRCACPP